MTEGRKQKLRQLLEEATNSLVIRLDNFPSPLLTDVYKRQLPVETFKKCLTEDWSSFSEKSKSILYDFRPDIESRVTASKLLDFIREELSTFIKEDRILHASFALGGTGHGIHLDTVFQLLLKNMIARGTDEAVLAFDMCTKDTHFIFHRATLLLGIKLVAPIQLFDAIRLVPLPSSQCKIPFYLPRMSLLGFSEKAFYSQTLLIIDYSVSPIFHRPSLSNAATVDEHFQEKERFRVKLCGGHFPDFVEGEFFCKIIPALSLACNSSVQIPMSWEFLAENEFFNDNHISLATRTHNVLQIGNPTEVGKPEIEKAKHLYRILDQNLELWEKLRIPIDRWIKSKAAGDSVNQMIDLRIALEALYATRKTGVMQQVSSSGARHLGTCKAKDYKDELRIKFDQIYRCCSDAVHDGKLPQTASLGEKCLPMPEFIANAQDLCRQSILKILEDGKFPI